MDISHSMIDFSGFDPAAEVRIDARTLTIRMQFEDEETALEARMDTRAAPVEIQELGVTVILVIVVLLICSPWGVGSRQPSSSSSAFAGAFQRRAADRRRLEDRNCEIWATLTLRRWA